MNKPVSKMNENYKFEIEFLSEEEDKLDESNNRRKLTIEETNSIGEKYPNLSQEFLDYLREVGEGAFRECQFAVRSELIDLSDIGLDEHYEIKKTIKFFGDNFSGDMAGFDLENSDGLVVEFWHESGDIFNTNKTFKQYIREQMLIDENGKDLRVK
jgi:hypothetical protein